MLPSMTDAHASGPPRSGRLRQGRRLTGRPEPDEITADVPAHAEAEHSPHALEARRNRARALGTGLGMNVLANLIANLVTVGILYIGAVLAGFIQGRPILLGLSILVVLWAIDSFAGNAVYYFFGATKKVRLVYRVATLAMFVAFWVIFLIVLSRLGYRIF
jgi:hypothetical protein